MVEERDEKNLAIALLQCFHCNNIFSASTIHQAVKNEDAALSKRPLENTAVSPIRYATRFIH